MVNNVTLYVNAVGLLGYHGETAEFLDNKPHTIDHSKGFKLSRIYSISVRMSCSPTTALLQHTSGKSLTVERSTTLPNYNMHD